MYYKHSLNDLLSIFLIVKIYIVLRSLLNLTAYSSPRASRLCEQQCLEHNYIYIIKCFMKEAPLKAITIIFVICLLLFSYALKLSEGMLFLYNVGLTTGF
jgi:hypothetical protein